MARKCQLAREVKRAKLIQQYLERRRALRKAQSSAKLSEQEKQSAMVKLGKLPRDSSPSRKTTRCVITGTSRSVYKKFMLNRISFRKMASKGLLPGIIKSSW